MPRLMPIDESWPKIRTIMLLYGQAQSSNNGQGNTIPNVRTVLRDLPLKFYVPKI